MSDFTSIQLQVNVGSNGSPSYQDQVGANKEIRFHDTSTVSLSTASAVWPNVTRPGATAAVPYAYGFSADTTGLGVLGSSGAPTAFSNANYLWGRWSWDNTGTFASAPIFTCFASTAHAAITRGDGTILAGHASDTGATARSYIKANAHGRLGTTVGAPTAAPANAPTVTDGTTGSVSPSAGNNWLTNYQGLQGNNDYITAPFTPGATTADTWYVIMAMFMGPNETPATYTPVASLEYTYT